MSTIPLGDIFGAFGADQAEVDRLKRELAAMTTRAARAEQKIANALALIRDPGEAHRMLTRTELQRLLR